MENLRNRLGGNQWRVSADNWNKIQRPIGSAGTLCKVFAGFSERGQTKSNTHIQMHTRTFGHSTGLNSRGGCSGDATNNQRPITIQQMNGRFLRFFFISRCMLFFFRFFFCVTLSAFRWATIRDKEKIKQEIGKTRKNERQEGMVCSSWAQLFVQSYFKKKKIVWVDVWVFGSVRVRMCPCAGELLCAARNIYISLTSAQVISTGYVYATEEPFFRVEILLCIPIMFSFFSWYLQWGIGFVFFNLITKNEKQRNNNRSVDFDKHSHASDALITTFPFFFLFQIVPPAIRMITFVFTLT